MNAPLLVTVERRKHVRHDIILPAKISLGDNGELLPCTVLDVSLGGGRIKLHQHIDLPDRITLLFTPSGSVQRSCRVVWRRGDQVGLEFFGQFDRLDQVPGFNGT